MNIKIAAAYFLSIGIFTAIAPSFAASPQRAAANLPILLYHQIRVRPDGPPDGMTVISYERLEEEMAYLHQQGYLTLSMDEVVAFLKGKAFPEKIVGINFDDGMLSAIYAVPLLHRYGLKATFWVIPGTTDPDPPEPGTNRSYMSWGILRDLDKDPDIKVYSHTMSHPWIAGDTLVDWVEGRTPGKGVENARWELAESKRQLEEKLGHPVPYLAWPDGLYDDALVALAKQTGYTALVTTDDTSNRPGGDPFRIHRTIIDGACDLGSFKQIVTDGKYRDC